MTQPEIQVATTPADQKRYDEAIAKGREVIANGGSKADAARAIYEMLLDERREVIIKAFVDGASLTAKGSPTYFYNITRQFSKRRKKQMK